ncbi:hypothetical protein D6855_05725 [Butyrivibrio sp. CB08]|uniref:hypothetical protein n=1 Tax=Butyrivibrio sp. CB08 TaxID=2364879 RepID=UPI000EA9F0A3|nr:hypothetical protein [Butyrivibrio sp. CB08]RKM61390.1 hypothetical protein D6855_05725 [Butyrivibrio sp. CB08]
MRAKKIDVISLLCLLEVLAIGIIFIPRAFPFLILPDEFGYWYNAAKALGFPWEDIQSLGSFYSYGYSALLLPVMALFRSPLSAYRAALVINLILMIASFALLKKDLGKESYLALIFPPLIIYSLSTMSEIALFFLLVVTVIRLKKFSENVTIRNGALFLLPAFLAFITHNRMLPVLALAILITLEKTSDNGKKLSGVFLALVFAALFALTFPAKTYFTSGITQSAAYASTGFLAMISKIRNLFSLEGAIRFVVSLLGNFFYLVASTLGLGTLGLKRLVRMTRDKDDVSYFILVSLVLEALLSSLFLFGGDSFTSVLYGRYLDPFCALLLVLGAKEFLEEEGNIRWIMGGLAAAAVGLLAVLVRIGGYGDYDGILCIGAGYLSFAFTDVKAFLVAAFALSGLIIFSLLVFKMNLGGKAAMSMAIMVFAVLSILLTITVWEDASSFVRGEAEVAEEIAGQTKGEVYYINEDGADAVQMLQFYLGGQQVRITTPEEIALLPKDATVVTMSYSGLDDALSGAYELGTTSNCFKIWMPR